MDPKVPPKFTSPNKPPNISTMTQEEREEMFHRIGKVENKMDENRKDMEMIMDENREHMERRC
jgi:hypothetical protein